MNPGPGLYSRIIATARVYLHHHWRRALAVRERLRLSDAAFHLVMAAVVRVIGGMCNFLFYAAIEWVKHYTLRQPEDFGEITELLGCAVATPFPEIAGHFLRTTYNFLPVVDAENRLLGVVALHDLKEHLGAGAEPNVLIASAVMRPAPACLAPDQWLSAALPVLLASELRNVPVVNNRTERQLLGSVVRAEALGMLSEAIAARGETGA